MILQVWFLLKIFYFFTIPHSEFLKFVKYHPSKTNGAFSAAFVEAGKKCVCVWLIFLSQANLIVWLSKPGKPTDRGILEATDKVPPLIQIHLSCPKHLPQVRALICYLHSVWCWAGKEKTDSLGQYRYFCVSAFGRYVYVALPKSSSACKGYLCLKRRYVSFVKD